MKVRPRAVLTALILLTVVSAPSAQQRIEDMKEFNAGHLAYRTHVYLEFSSRSSSQVVLFPDDGFSGKTFRDKPDGTPSWGRMLQARDFNAYMFDHVGCGSSIPPPDENIVPMTEKTAFGVFQMMVATKAQMVIAHGMSAGFAIKGCTQREDAGHSLVLIDPIGPQGWQDFTDLTPADLFERRQNLDDALWQEWGFGKRAGRLRSGIDVDAATADSLLAGYERDQPHYAMTLLTGIDTDTQVNETLHLEDVPVLVVRTTAADATQIAREEQVARRLVEAGCRVERLDLGAVEGLEDTTGLPWVGAKAEAVLEELLAWYERQDVEPPTPWGRR